MKKINKIKDASNITLKPITDDAPKEATKIQVCKNPFIIALKCWKWNWDALANMKPPNPSYISFPFLFFAQNWKQINRVYSIFNGKRETCKWQGTVKLLEVRLAKSCRQKKLKTKNEKIGTFGKRMHFETCKLQV